MTHRRCRCASPREMRHTAGAMCRTTSRVSPGRSTGRAVERSRPCKSWKTRGGRGDFPQDAGSARVLRKITSRSAGFPRNACCGPPRRRRIARLDRGDPRHRPGPHPFDAVVDLPSPDPAARTVRTARGFRATLSPRDLSQIAGQACTGRHSAPTNPGVRSPTAAWRCGCSMTALTSRGERLLGLLSTALGRRPLPPRTTMDEVSAFARVTHWT
jgi:hypothetical protein